MTTLVATSLVTAFLNLAENPAIQIHDDITELGKIGTKAMSIAARDEWLTLQKENNATSTVVLIQNCVCDPASGELVLKEIDAEKLKLLPATLSDQLLKKIFAQNGIKTKADELKEGQNELKNSETTQS